MSVISSMVVALSADTAKFEKGMKRAQKVLNGISKSATLVGGAITAAMTVATKKFVDTGSALVDMSAHTGIAVESLSALKFAAEQSGSSMDAIDRAFKALARNVTRGDKAFAQFGLSVQELQQMQPEQQFLKIADAIASIEDPTRRSAAAQKLLGKQAVELLPLFTKGGEGIRPLMEKARELGLVMSTETARAAESLGDRIEALQSRFGALLAKIGEGLLPLLDRLVGRFENVATSVQGVVSVNKDLSETVAVVGVAFASLGIASAGLSKLFGLIQSGVLVVVRVFRLLLTVIAPVITAIVGLGTVIAFTFGLPVTTAVAAVTAIVTALGALVYWFIRCTDTGKAFADAIGNYLGEVVDSILGPIRELLKYMGLLEKTSGVTMKPLSEEAIAALNNPNIASNMNQAQIAQKQIRNPLQEQILNPEKKAIDPKSQANALLNAMTGADILNSSPGAKSVTKFTTAVDAFKDSFRPLPKVIKNLTDVQKAQTKVDLTNQAFDLLNGISGGAVSQTATREQQRNPIQPAAPPDLTKTTAAITSNSAEFLKDLAAGQAGEQERRKAEKEAKKLMQEQKNYLRDIAKNTSGGGVQLASIGGA